MSIAFEPQPGPQTEFCATSADVAIYGGAAGGGKSFGLELEATRGVDIPGYTAIIFRRTTPEIRNPGGLWDESVNIFSHIGNARGFSSSLTWQFYSGAQIKFAHLEHEKTKLSHQGAQYAFIGFDELTHFTETQFWYLLSRNRSTCGVRPYLRATCNPDPDSFVARLIEWYIDPETGFAIPERSGVIRWFLRIGGELEWFNSEDEILERYGKEGESGERYLPDEFTPKSFTFIASSVYDNPILLQKDPGYIANLNALTLVDRERLKHGNWKIRGTAGNLCRRDWFEIVDAVPAPKKRSVRYWDKAATEPNADNPNPDWTAGARMTEGGDGIYYIEDIRHDRLRPLGVDNLMRATASQDGLLVQQGFEQEPGASGKQDAEHTIRNLRGYPVKAYPKRVNKLVAWKPLLAQAEAGNVKLIRGEWNEAFLQEMEALDEQLVKENKIKDDQADAVSGAFGMLQKSGPDYSILGRR